MPFFDNIIPVLAAVLALFLLILLGCSVGLKLGRFCEELRYVNEELRRCPGSQRARWLRRRRRLWLRLLIPFYRG